MIFGVGTDLCDVRRIRAVLARRGDRFAERVLGPNELIVFHARRAQHEERGIRYLATRFSAKEAFSKAIGLGVNAGHDLNRDNLGAFLAAVPGVLEVSIGHAFVADALELGMADAVRAYCRVIESGSAS